MIEGNRERDVRNDIEGYKKLATSIHHRTVKSC